MSLRRLFIPTWSGDYRLEAHKAGSLFTVTDPTPGEKIRIRTFLEHARAQGWIDALDGVMPKGETRIVVKASIADAGRLLVSKAFESDNRERWVAIRSVSGRIRVVSDATEVANLAPLDDPEAEVAAVTPAPNRGCPPPEPCNRRAAEVLRAFTTPRQFEDWQATGSMLVDGNITGRRYRLYHRDEAARRGLRHTLLTAEGADVCVWDDTVPAEEEALGILLTVEHNEGYIFANGGTLGIEGGLRDGGIRRGSLVNANTARPRPPRNAGWKS